MRLEIYRNISIVWSMVHVIVLFLMLFRSRYPKKKTLLISGIGMALLMAGNLAAVLAFGADAVGQWFLLTCSVPSFLFFWFLSEDRRIRFVFTFCLADTAVMWVIGVTLLLDYYLGGGRMLVMLIGRLILLPVLEYTAYRYLRKPYMELQASVAKGWGIFTGMTLLYYLLLALMMNYPVNLLQRPEDMLVVFLLLLLMLFNYGTIFAALYGQYQSYRWQQNERSLLEQRRSLEAQLENQKNIHRLKHDMKAHTITLSGLLAQGENEQAIHYLRRMVNQMEAAQEELCANPYLQAVFGHYCQRFEEAGMRLTLDIRVGEEELPYMDLCQILSNGLENAYDEMKELTEEPKEASVQMKYSHDYLILRLKNRCRPSRQIEKGTIPATDKPGAGHGFGIQTIQEAARRLSGEMFCYTENGTFVLDVMVRVSMDYSN